MNTQRNLIIDSNNLLHRVHWVCEKYGNTTIPKMFFTCVRSYINDHYISPGCVYMAWDDKLVRGSTNHRKTSDDVEYKSTRDADKNRKVYELYKHIHKMCKHAGLINMHPGVLEADDVVAYLSKKLSGHNVIVSVDQDLLQLIDNTNDVYNPIKKQIITYENFEQFQPVPVELFVTYKAAMGDKSDNIDGLEKVGKKRAAQIARSGIDGLTTEQKEIVHRNIKLMDLNYSLNSYPGEVKLYDKQLDFHETEVDVDKFIQECNDIECSDISREFVESICIHKSPPVKVSSIFS
jgi:5'-3' exonuclease